MLLAQAADTARWPAAAVRDTVAAIAREPAYGRSFTTSLFQRMLSWLGELWARILGPVAHALNLRYVALGFVVVLATLAIARLIYVVRVGDGDGVRPPIGTSRAPGGDAWADADQLARSGEFTAAAHALYAALLARLAAGGEVRVHPSKTAGDYARELRRRASRAQPAFQSFRVRYDRVIYGTGRCSADDFAALLRDARPLLECAA